MSRYAPPARDRSPPKYDRRPSYSVGGSSYRGTGEPQPPSDRDPPRGPRAENFRGGGYQFNPVGRGRGGGAFPTRPGDAWRDRDRDRDRDTRQPQSYRGRDEDWSRRDRDPGPPERPPIVNRDSGRHYPPYDRSASPPRVRRGSRDSLPPLSTRPSDNAASFRGGRGRGRGDWTDRPRDRTSFVSERDRDRDLFSNRSSSRDSTWRERDLDRGRQAGPDADRGDRYTGRDRSRERRDHDIWPREHSPSRMATSAAARVPSPANSTGQYPSAVDRASKMDYEPTRRGSVVATPSSAARDVRRDVEGGDYFQRGEPRRETSYSSLHQAPPTQPPPTAGLDYGPAPPAPVSGPSEKLPPPRAQNAKPISPALSSTPFQPPSGPKADRAPSTSMPKPTAAYDPPKSEQQPMRPTFGSTPIPTPRSATELFPKKLEQKPENKATAQGPSTDKGMPPYIPSGPRSASFGSSYRGRPPLSDVSPQFTPQKLVLADNRPQIPTGPRSDRDGRDGRDNREGPWQPGVPNNSTRTWVSPEYNRAKPSIMSPISRAPAFPPTGPRSQSTLPPHADKGRPHPPSIMNSAHSTKPSLLANLRAKDNAPSTTGSTTEDVDMSLPVSSDEEAEDDDFDEDEFAASEAQHQKNVRAKEASKPPPIYHDGSLRTHILQLLVLEMIADESISQLSQIQSDYSELVDAPQARHGLPSPDGRSDDDYKPEIHQPLPQGRLLKDPPVNPIPTPPVEDLPYLGARIHEPLAFEDSDDEMYLEAVATLVREQFEQISVDEQEEHEQLCDDYRTRYGSWKEELSSFDRANRDAHVTPAPASPAPSAAPSVTPSISHERTRGGRNTTEADLQAAIALSQQTMKEEEERREREAQESPVPNYEHEAVIPPMLSRDELVMKEYEDTSGLIPLIMAIDVLRYLPPQDDFTPEEQELFIHAYCQTPKKWGKIAEALPGRDFKQCISHYYLTKAEAKYKEIWRRAQPKKKRGRAAASQKPRSTALITELTYRDGEDGAVAVTDTGRPRRAAAPTFGENGTESEAPPSTVPAKRGASGKDGPTDAPVTKPARSRRTGATTKPRRSKAQQLEDKANAQAALLGQGPSQMPIDMLENSPQKTVAARERSRTLLRVDEGPLAKGESTLAMTMVKGFDSDQQGPGGEEKQNLAAQAMNQPTSYWSVPEQTKFPQLIAYFGRDFTAIADFMKTKTSTMIKNFYNRQLADGKTDLEQTAKEAEAKRASGQMMGRPPSPAVQTKRRYEATPSIASGTQIARSTVDQQPNEADYPPLSSKQDYTEDFPANVVQRNYTGDLVAKARPELAMHQPKQEEPRRELLSKPATGLGPRLGFFRDEPSLPFGGHRQNTSRDNSPHQHPLRPGDPRFGEIAQRLPAGSPRQLNLGPPRDIAPAHASGQNVLSGSSLHSSQYGMSLLQQTHARNGSAAGHGQSALEPAQNLASLRQGDPLQRYPLQNPLAPPAHHPASSQYRKEVLPHSSAPAEAPKPAPAKRSTIMNLLNDDPPDPAPPKHSSSDSQNRSSMMSPQTVPHPGSRYDPGRNPLRLDGSPIDIDRKRTPLGFSPHPLREQQQPGYGPSQPSGQHNETWLDKFDPRPQSGPGDHRSLHSSPRTSQYSVVPPGSSGLRMEAPRPGEQQMSEHRRLMGQLSHPGSVASPPPTQGPSYRSLSASSQNPHTRVGSGAFSSTSLNATQPHHISQSSNLPSSHPQSNSSTPVSSLHHGRSSIDFGQHGRQTIQQHIHLQRGDSQSSYREQEKESDIAYAREQEAFRAAREHEAIVAERERHERENFRMAERDPYSFRRPLGATGFGPPPPREGVGHTNQHATQHQHSQPPLQQRPLGYPQDPLQRTYTPSQQQQHQPAGQLNAPQSAGQPPPRPGSQYHHHAQSGPKMLGQGPSPPPGQSNHPAYMSHYRSMSQDERR